MTYNHDSFKGSTNNDIITFITDINDALNEDLQIADSQSNIRTLCEYLNKYNAQQIIGVPFNMNNLNIFLYNKQKRRADNEFFNNIDKNEYKANDALDEFIRMNTQNKFDNEHKPFKIHFQYLREMSFIHTLWRRKLLSI